MIQDINRIRQELQGFREVELPYEFPLATPIKYITLKNENESFYVGGVYTGQGDNCLYVKNSYKQWKIPLRVYTKEGKVRYHTRIFIQDAPCEPCLNAVDVNELRDTLSNQQQLIEKLTQTILERDEVVQSLIEDKQTYEELLQQNRYNLKQLSVENKDKDTMIHKYQGILQKLSLSVQR
jgi:hypothetical protein|tara:strand:- start:2151 stop:2690 length:540 start_codon:yes stop_codon:yes gene_type:complete